MSRAVRAACAAGMLTLAVPAVAEAAADGRSGGERVAARTYWSFDNTKRGCLSGGDSGSAFEGPCRSGSEHQDWYWKGTSHDMLANRATGKCLTTDIRSGPGRANAVWTASCKESNKGQHWSYNDYSGLLRSRHATYLRADKNGSGAVFADNANIGGLSYYIWSGSHT
ncbi:hypothetical protein ACZ90_31875 [Streptomyces albus subsp. albus]|nr:hypothetical protein ACZ90_31875 [Streptomyces albus subsp. albus]